MIRHGWWYTVIKPVSEEGETIKHGTVGKKQPTVPDGFTCYRERESGSSGRLELESSLNI